MSIEDRIKSIREKIDNQVIAKAKAESRLEQLEKEEKDIIEKCKALDIDYKDLDNLLADTNNKLESLVAEAEQILNGTANSTDIKKDELPF